MCETRSDKIHPEFICEENTNIHKPNKPPCTHTLEKNISQPLRHGSHVLFNMSKYQLWFNVYVKIFVQPVVFFCPIMVVFRISKFWVASYGICFRWQIFFPLISLTQGSLFNLIFRWCGCYTQTLGLLYWLLALMPFISCGNGCVMSEILLAR